MNKEKLVIYLREKIKYNKDFALIDLDVIREILYLIKIDSENRIEQTIEDDQSSIKQNEIVTSYKKLPSFLDFTMVLLEFLLLGTVIILLTYIVIIEPIMQILFKTS